MGFWLFHKRNRNQLLIGGIDIATIHRSTIFIETESLVDSLAFNQDDKVGYFKREDKWLAKDKEDVHKTWRVFPNMLRNEALIKIIHQYSMPDIIYYLFSRNSDYQTVYWSMLEDAVRETFEETRVTCLEDIYEYISSNLI